MSGHSDVNDERRPLLAEQSTEQREGEEPPVTTVKDDDLDWRWYTFYGVLTVLGIAILSLLIKGFIDSGDKEVRIP